MNNKQLADKLTTELTGILQYVVTDDIQLFSKDMRLGNIEYVPAVLTTIASFDNENRFIRNETYQLAFKVRAELKDDFYADMMAFKATQTTEIIGSYIVTKVVERPIFTLKGVDNGIDYFEYNLEIRWTWTLSKVGTSTVIKVDDVIVPFVSCDVSHDIAYVSNQTQGTNYRMTNDVVVLIVPLILSNAKVLALYESSDSDTYNKTYELTIDGFTKLMVLKRINYTFANTATVTNMILTFETHYPRVEILLNGVSLPITSYTYTGKKVYNTSGRDSDIQKGYAMLKVRTWAITFVLNDSVTSNALLDDAYGNTVGGTHTLRVDGVDYTVELAEVAERFTETGGMALECNFVEVS